MGYAAGVQATDIDEVLASPALPAVPRVRDDPSASSSRASHPRQLAFTSAGWATREWQALSPAPQLTYRVKAVNAGGESVSNEVMIQVP